MTKNIIISLSLLGFLAGVAHYFSQKKSNYAYSFSLPKTSEEKLHLDFVSEVDFSLDRIKKNPTSHQALSALAQLFLKRADYLGSSLYFTQAAIYAYRSLKLMPTQNPGAFYVLAKIAEADRNFSRAILYAQLILQQKKSSSPEAFLLLSTSNLALGNLEQAMAWVDELIAIFPSEKAYTLRASILAEQGRDQEAILDFEEAIKLLEDDPIQASETRAKYGQFLIDQPAQKNYLENARDLLNEALKINPRSSLALEVMGKLFEKEKKFQEASNFYQKAFRQSREIRYLVMEAKAQKFANKEELSKALYKQAEILLRFDLKESRTARTIDLIRLMLERGDTRDFAETMRLASKEKTLHPNSETLALYTWAMEMNGQLLEARKSIRGLLAKNIRTEAILARASIIEEKLKNEKLADVYRTSAHLERAL